MYYGIIHSCGQHQSQWPLRRTILSVCCQPRTRALDSSAISRLNARRDLLCCHAIPQPSSGMCTWVHGVCYVVRFCERVCVRCLGGRA